MISEGKIAVLAAGSGGKTLAMGLRELSRVKAELYTIITDSGGSSSTWRKHGAPGDMRRQISSLMEDPYMAAAFELRNPDGPFPDHPMGNQFIYALAEACGGDLDQVAVKINERFSLMLPVYPISQRPDTPGEYPHLCGQYANGNTFLEESEIDHPSDENKVSRITKAWLSQPVRVNPRLSSGLLNGEFNVLAIGPGSLFGSTAAALLTSGLAESIDQAPNLSVVYTCNLATRPGETTGMSVADHLDTINAYLGKHKVDVCIISTHRPTEEMIQRYESQQQEILAPTPDEIKALPCRVLTGDYLIPGNEGEARHDPMRLAIELRRIAGGDYWYWASIFGSALFFLPLHHAWLLAYYR